MTGPGQRVARRWASWELGELSDDVWHAASVLSSVTPVESLTVRPPAGRGLPPRVLVVVPDQEWVMRLSAAVSAESGFLGFTGRFEQRRWTVDLGDLELTVATREGTDQAELDTVTEAAPAASPDLASETPLPGLGAPPRSAGDDGVATGRADPWGDAAGRGPGVA